MNARFKKTKDFRKQFVVDLLKELMTVRTNVVICKDLFDIIEDILRHFDSEDNEEHDTNQSVVGMQCLFRGYAAKV